MDVKARITDHVNTVLGPKTIAGSSAGPRWTHKNLPKLLKDLLDKVMEKEVTELIVVLESALKTDLPGDIKHGHFIANGYDSKLDEVRKLRDSSKEVVQALGPKYKAQTHATSIKMKNNRNLGWYIELSAREEGKLKPPTFNHVQTRVGFMCFKTAELLQLEDRINRAATEAQELEEDIFVELSKQVLEASDIVKQAAHVLASLDVACAGSLMAKEKGLVRPSIEKSFVMTHFMEVL
jgi:DNA mismatch repair protein MutS